MLSIERLLVLVEQYIITVEVRMLFSGTTPVKSLIEAFLELTTLNASIKCMRVGCGNHTPFLTPPLCVLVIFSYLYEEKQGLWEVYCCNTLCCFVIILKLSFIFFRISMPVPVHFYRMVLHFMAILSQSMCLLIFHGRSLLYRYAAQSKCFLVVGKITSVVGSRGCRGIFAMSLFGRHLGCNCKSIDCWPLTQLIFTQLCLRCFLA